jgi:hypothetical protein
MAEDKPAAPTDATVSNRAIGAVTLATGEDGTRDAEEPLAPPAPPAANAGEDPDAGAIASAFIADTLHTSTNCEGNGRTQQYCRISDWRSHSLWRWPGPRPFGRLAVVADTITKASDVLHIKTERLESTRTDHK